MQIQGFIARSFSRVFLFKLLKKYLLLYNKPTYHTIATTKAIIFFCIDQYDFNRPKEPILTSTYTLVLHFTPYIHRNRDPIAVGCYLFEWHICSLYESNTGGKRVFNVCIISCSLYVKYNMLQFRMSNSFSTLDRR